MIVRAYTVAEYENFAPNIQGDMLTLATCMPALRQGAKRGEWIVGISPAPWLNLVFAFQVEDVVSRKAYWDVYPCGTRLDSIYVPDGSPMGFRQVDNPWHGPNRIKYDLRSDNVLVSKRFFNFSQGYYYQPEEMDGLPIPARYSALRRRAMRGAGHFIEVPDSFLRWVSHRPIATLQTLDNPEGIALCG